MKRFLSTLIPLLLLAIGLFPSELARANSEKFSHGLSAQQVIAEVNALRISDNLPPYIVNDVLMSIAQSHADYIAGTGVLTHFSENGDHPYERAISAGYAVAGDLSLGGFFSENINSGPGLSASAVVDDWKGDPAHLTTMVSPDLKDIGVGISIVDGVTYYVLDAGASMDDLAAIQTNSPVFTPTRDSGTPVVNVPISTPLENGDVYHVVQLKEALWSIALAYNTTVEQIKLLNGLATDEIFAGQKLLVYKPEISTPTPTVAVTATFGIPTSTATHPVTATATSTATPLPVPPVSIQGSGIIVGIIVVIALFAAGIGSWLGRKKPL